VPNYKIENLMAIKSYMDLHSIKNQSVIIDVSHDNCIFNGKKDFRMQPDIFFNILNELQDNSFCKGLVKGFMIESFLLEGNQEITPNINKEGLSITDPCIGWEDTENMLLKLASFRR
jgi:3-deoxy-7-phosphoheptulonate synthase